MDMYYIEKRKKALDNTILKESFISIDTLKNNCITHPSHKNILKFVENYNSFRGNHNSFNNMLDIIAEYYLNNNDKNINDILYAINNTIPYEKNLRDVKESLEYFSRRTLIDVTLVMSEVNDYITADRIINNRNNINNRFNIDKFINEDKVYIEEDKISLIEELCVMVDTFNCNKELKYNLALENISYEFYRKGISIDKEKLLSTITEYFSIQNVDIEAVLEINTVFNHKVKGNILNNIKSKSISKVKEFINKLRNTEIRTPEQIRPILRLMYSQSAKQVLDDLPNFLTWMRTFLIFTAFTVNPYIAVIALLTDQFIASNVKKTEAERMIREYKHEIEVCKNKLNKLKNRDAKVNLEEYIRTLEHSITKLEEYRDSLYSERGLENMQNEISIEKKHLLDSLNEGTVGYRPYFMNTDRFFEKYNYEFNKQCDIILKEMKKYNNCVTIRESLELDYVNYKLIHPENIHNFLTESGNLYIKIGTVDSKDEEMMFENVSKFLSEGYLLSTEEKNDKTSIYLMSEYCIEPDKEIIHKEILETAEIITSIEEALTYVMDNSNILIENTQKYFNQLDGEILQDLSFITSMNEFVSNSEMKDIILESMGDITPEEWDKMYQARRARENLDYKYIPINKDENIYRLVKMKEVVQDIKESFDILNEGSNIRDNLVMLKEKIRKSAVKVSDKDAQYSHQIDNLVDNMITKTSKNLTNKNRESVIKGSILPSASAVIKLAIASGAVGVINPALAVVAFLGGLAVSKIGTERERQYILDEIEIEKKLLDKKIQLAERNDDTKALAQLYRLEKQLTREETRIKYNKKDFRPIQNDK